jgi:PBSX family phage terminase large subunit
MEKEIRVLCCREIQKSIKDSVHQLLKDQIKVLGLTDIFHVTDVKITEKTTGSTIVFDGIREANIDVKSKEGIDICWVEEAEKYSKESDNVLRPTIRKPGSEIWYSFNTPSVDDYIYELFVVNPPSNAKVYKTYYYHCPGISNEILQEAEDCKTRDPEGYQHIWLGEPAKTGLRVYTKYNDKVHNKVIDLNYMVENGNFFVGMDPHKTAFPAVLFGCKIPINAEKTEFDYYIYNEFPSRNTLKGKLYYEVRKTEKCSYTQKQLTGIFRTLETTIGSKQNKNVKVNIRACDPYFARGVGGSDWSSGTEGLVEEWARPENGGIIWTLPERNVLSVQRNTINQLMDYNDEIPISSINRPGLYIFPHCENLKTTLKLHRDSNEKDTEDEKHKDFSDALRILMAVMHYTPYKQNKKSSYIPPVKPLLNKKLFTKLTVGIS